MMAGKPRIVNFGGVVPPKPLNETSDRSTWQGQLVDGDLRGYHCPDDGYYRVVNIRTEEVLVAMLINGRIRPSEAMTLWIDGYRAGRTA